MFPISTFGPQGLAWWIVLAGVKSFRASGMLPRP
jgi:hypothetical protein